jgi:hypothetical protein
MAVPAYVILLSLPLSGFSLKQPPQTTTEKQITNVSSHGGSSGHLEKITTFFSLILPRFSFSLPG